MQTGELQIADKLNLSEFNWSYDHLKGLGLTSNLDIWVSHVLTERNLYGGIDVCDLLFKLQENDPFLRRINTSETEKTKIDQNRKRCTVPPR